MASFGRCVRSYDNALPFVEEWCGPHGKICDSNSTVRSFGSEFCVKGLVCSGNLTVIGGSPGLQVCNAVS